MKRTRRFLSAVLACIMMLSCMTGVASAESETNWAEQSMKGGWILVTQEGGDTLGYSPDSGVTILEADGFAFKDMNKNGQLDTYEDWRLTDAERAAALAQMLSAEQIFPLMYHNTIKTLSNKLSDADTALVEAGLRAAVLRGVAPETAVTVATMDNVLQALCEKLDFAIPFNITTDPVSSLANMPDNSALAATFDTELAKEASNEMAKRYRSMGIRMLLGPQMDLTSEPTWTRFSGAFSEDPALTRDMAIATISGYQSTYDAEGNDLGWGDESVAATAKHYIAEASAEGGREGHSDAGKYSVFPGNNFDAHLIGFFDGALKLGTATEEVASMMSSYSIAYTEDESLGELVGSTFSAYKIGLLRNNGYDGVLVSDWKVLDPDFGRGVEGLSAAERIVLGVKAGMDQFGGSFDVESLSSIAEAYDMMVAELGEEATLARFRESARRIFESLMEMELFENPYVDVNHTEEVINDPVGYELGKEVALKSVIMLKNENSAIAPAAESSEKETVYIPLVYTPTTSKLMAGQIKVTPASWGESPLAAAAAQYYNVITDTVGEPTGEPDADGNPTYTADDVIRPTAEELAACSKAIIFITSPSNSTYDDATGEYYPYSLQYGEYTADSDAVRQEAIANGVQVTIIDTPYGTSTVETVEDRSYYGKTVTATNTHDIDPIHYAAENLPDEASVIVCLTMNNPTVVAEFEPDADAILVSMVTTDDSIYEIISGKVEPSGLLPCQMPKDMVAVEAELEDVPRDMECYVDASGNTYDFTFGLNWAGVINDDRVAKYNVPALTTPETEIAK